MKHKSELKVQKAATREIKQQENPPRQGTRGKGTRGKGLAKRKSDNIPSLIIKAFTKESKE